MQTLENAKIFIANHDILFSHYFFSIFTTTHNNKRSLYFHILVSIEPSTLLFIDASHQQINGHKQQLNQNLSDKTIEHAMLNEFQLKTS